MADIFFILIIFTKVFLLFVWIYHYLNYFYIPDNEKSAKKLYVNLVNAKSFLNTKKSSLSGRYWPPSISSKVILSESSITSSKGYFFSLLIKNLKNKFLLIKKKINQFQIHLRTLWKFCKRICYLFSSNTLVCKHFLHNISKELLVYWAPFWYFCISSFYPQFFFWNFICQC